MKAEAFRLRAIGIEDKVFGPDHPEVTTTLNQQALMLYKQVKRVYPHGLRVSSIGLDEHVAGRHDRLSEQLVQNMF